MRLISVASAAAAVITALCFGDTLSANPLPAVGEVPAPNRPHTTPGLFVERLHPFGQAKSLTAIVRLRGKLGFIKCPTNALLLDVEYSALKTIQTSMPSVHGMKDSVKDLFVPLRGLVQLRGQNCLMIDVVDGKNLRAHIDSLSPQEKIEQLPSIFFQLTMALRYLHRIGRTHGDIKPENSWDKSPKIKLIDFDTSVPVCWKGGKIGSTSGYEAPEEDLGKPIDHVVRDSWLLGATMFSALTGNSPKGLDYKAQVEMGNLQPDVMVEDRAPSSSSEESDTPTGTPQQKAFMEIMEKLLDGNPEARPTINSLDDALLKRLLVQKSFFERIQEFGSNMVNAFSSIPQCRPDTLF
ncbi:kinase-like domain-containing protein [Thamnocephalis sphaerospora]|uniref:Kinase-like domain-containing protein n=1 Tax=Thamnocephalis sphaerospora TaxID=78915 RepID=A0A4P9XID7_9FUNG|nr:kinase-like domain-containing protein [Thamnocephalis sphaerospora]|eukprot:RKP05452.1 kinase-like domain-containing protein [Thamnocephalis sphaerospora]